MRQKRIQRACPTVATDEAKEQLRIACAFVGNAREVLEDFSLIASGEIAAE